MFSIPIFGTFTKSDVLYTLNKYVSKTNLINIVVVHMISILFLCTNSETCQNLRFYIETIATCLLSTVLFSTHQSPALT